MSDSTKSKPEVVVADGWTFGPPQPLRVPISDLISKHASKMAFQPLPRGKPRPPKTGKR